MFSPLQTAMLGDPAFITITPALVSCLEDWGYFTRYMSKHPTHVSQLVQKYPDYIGFSDSCRLGTGGVWVGGTKGVTPFLWHYEFPPDIQQSLVTEANPNGSISMNDLELAGIVLNMLALEAYGVALKHCHLATFCDNTSAVSWAYKLRTSRSKRAGKLLRLLGLRIHVRQASGLTPLNIAGEENTMADVVSRAFKQGEYEHISHNLVHYFNSHFTLPQGTSWTEFLLPTKLVSVVISCLRGQELPMASLLKLPVNVKNTGNIGQHTPPGVEWTHTLNTHRPLKETKLSKDLRPESEGAPTAEGLRSRYQASQTPSLPSQRPLSWLANVVPSTAKNKRIN